MLPMRAAALLAEATVWSAVAASRARSAATAASVTRLRAASIRKDK